VLCGYLACKKTCADLAAHPEFTKLQPDLTGMDPDDAFSKIPYENGSLFLFYLEQKVGGEEAMQRWLKEYFTKFRTGSVSTAMMRAHFLDHFRSKGVSEAALGSIEWDTWLKQPGLPAFDPTPLLDQSLATAATALAGKWKQDKGAGAQPSDLQGIVAKQIMFFIDLLLLEACPMDSAVLDHLNAVYKLSQSPNVEITSRWINLNLKSNCKTIFPDAATFLSKHGRGLYVKPMYNELIRLDIAFARKVYNDNRSFYHSVIRNTFDAQLLQ